MIPPNYVGPNPLNYPVILIEETGEGNNKQTRELEFSDLQQAWCWARDQTGVEDFPFAQHHYGTHAGWDFMSFSFLKQEIEEKPDEEFEIFRSEAGEGHLRIAYVVSYADNEEDDEEMIPAAEEESVAPPSGSPKSSPAPATTAEDCFAFLGIDPHARCPHGLPTYACMPCSH